MKRPFLKKAFSLALAWGAAVALCGAMALAQDTAPASGQRTDGQIEMDVVQALDASQALKNDLITAATIQSEVTLAGTVSSESSLKLAESIASGVPGVTKVHNNLKVGNPANDQNAQGAPSPYSSDSGSQQTADNQPPDTAPEPPGPPSAGYPQDNGQGYPQNSPQGYPQGNAQGYPQDNGQGYPQGYPQGNAQGYPPNYPQSNGPGYPPPGYGQNQYPPSQRQPYPPQYGQTRRPTYELAKGPVTIPAGTLIQLRTSEPVSSKRATEGTPIQFTVIRDVTFGGVLAIPRGATVHGVVAGIRHPGELKGNAELALQLTSLDLAGQSYPLESDLFKVRGPGKGGRTAGNIVGGALIGAIIGGAAGGGGGAAIGAVAGGTVGTAASAATSGPGVWIPAEALVSFHLSAPITVNPVSQEEANRLAQGLYPGGPTLHRRGYYRRPYGYGYPYPNYYAPVYYRPYYFSGGFYYWR